MHLPTQFDTQIVWQPIPGTSQEIAMDSRCHHVLYSGSRGPGKSLDLNCLVLTDSGWKKAGEIGFSDKLVGIDGSFVDILGIFPQPSRQLYSVNFHNGSSVITDLAHRWKVKSQSSGVWLVRTTEQILKAKGTYSVPYLEGPVEGPRWQGLDPYWIGYMIANGTTKSSRLCAYTIDDDVLEYAESLGWYSWEGEQTAKRTVCPVHLEARWREVIPCRKGDEKHVPQGLLWADPESRLALLQGLMDGDGNAESGAKSRYSTVSEQLAKDICHLVKSLGGAASYNKRYRESSFGSRGWIIRVNISHHNKFNPFRIKRKAERWVEQTKHLTLGINSVTPSHIAESVCFSVDHPAKCFVIENFIVTHNTDAQLMRFRRLVGVGYGRFCRGIIFDREYKALDDLVAKSKRWFPLFEDGAKWKASKDTYKWVWPTGEELLFRQIKSTSDYSKYHGHEYNYLGWNELTKYPTSDCYDIMMSVNRTSFRPEDHPKFVDRHIYEEYGVEVPVDKDDPRALTLYLPELPLEVFSTTNPSGPGHSWVKKRFIDPVPYGVVLESRTKVFNPRTQQEEDVVKTQVALFGSYRENIYLTPEYVAELVNDPDENRKKAWLTGSWDIVAGGALGDLWKPHIHVLPRFVPPKGWKLDRSFDWGSSHPFSVGWWAMANGEEATIVHNGEAFTFCPPPGTLIQIGEWYGAKELGDNKGLKLSAVDIADGIVAREKVETKAGWYPSLPKGGPADNQIRDVRESDVDTIENKMKQRGVGWTRSDKSPGSRVNGLQLLRDRLVASIKGEGPGIYFMEHCRASIATLPILPRDDKNIDDVDTDAEDHAYDMVRYRVLAGAKELPTKTEFTFSL